MNIMNGISIIVCCYNSSLRLQPTLLHLAKQKTNLPFEVILVDNASTDDTFLEAQKIWNSFNTPVSFKIIKEPEAGLCYARNSGINEARYEYIVFCDDDNWLMENYIQIAYNFLIKNPEYVAIGGACQAIFEAGIIVPEWFEEFNSCYAVGIQGKEGDITSKGLLWGAGITFRKSIYKKIITDSLPPLLSGRNGTKMLAGDDNEICLRFIILGYKLYYTNKLNLKHYISSKRLTIDYRTNLINGFEASNDIINRYKFYISYVSGNRSYNKIKIFLKMGLHFFKIRNMTKIDENLVSNLKTYHFNKNDECFKIIRTLVRNKKYINK